MRLERAMFEIKALAEKADVVNPVRVSISFGDARDREHFIAEVMREIEPGKYPDRHDWHREFRMDGLLVRIV